MVIFSSPLDSLVDIMALHWRLKATMVHTSQVSPTDLKVYKVWVSEPVSYVLAPSLLSPLSELQNVNFRAKIPKIVSLRLF